MSDRTFPKPGVGVLIVRGGEVLFGVRKYPPAQGELDVIGGFVDPHESAETAVVREVREETGLEVEQVEYLGSAPDVYGDTGVPTLNLIYVATVPAGAAPVATDDVAAARPAPGPDGVPAPDRSARDAPRVGVAEHTALVTDRRAYGLAGRARLLPSLGCGSAGASPSQENGSTASSRCGRGWPAASHRGPG